MFACPSVLCSSVFPLLLPQTRSFQSLFHFVSRDSFEFDLICWTPPWPAVYGHWPSQDNKTVQHRTAHRSVSPHYRSPIADPMTPPTPSAIGSKP
ncbi:hypothetical protein BKA64DRAFT_123152 [Cadophora sp. MPI-SDFR-AT-0126]|nr:hypothetical protein BKA64DRAFT_123152 [Leotiomycetes sp. MPI-SDFR-AT-0126]